MLKNNSYRFRVNDCHQNSNKTPLTTTQCATDLDYQREMIIFKSLLTTSQLSLRQLGQQRKLACA